jgi:hypothetical protein
MMKWLALVSSVIVVLAPAGTAVMAARTDPFSALAAVAPITTEDRERLEAGQVVAKILPADGHELALLAVVSTTAAPEDLARSAADIVHLKMGPMVPEVGRFSSPPRLEDLAGLTLDDVDLEAIRNSRPGSSDLRLSDPEISRLQHAIAGGGDGWHSAADAEFRRIVFDRIVGYLANGHRGIAPYTGGGADLSAVFSSILQHTPYLRSRAPDIGEYFEQFPSSHAPHDEAFLYWSKEHLAPKPIISVTHVVIRREDGSHASSDTLVASKEVFSTRYKSGSLALTFLVDGTSASAPRYLVYLNRTWVDAVRTLWRPLVEWRVKRKAGKIFVEARDRIESGGR